MLFASGLLALVLILGVAAGSILDRAGWTVRQPGMALACWLGLLVGTFAAVTGLVGVVLLWPPAPGHALFERLHTCLPGHAHPHLEVATALSLAVLALCVIRLFRSLPRLGRAIFQRRRHREMLRILAYEDDDHTDVLVIDHPLPVAYCLPSRYRPIVVSTGAQNCLTPQELAAVLAHERAHLRQRHHLLLLLLDLTYGLLPWLPTVRRARTSVPVLLEMAADDAAARRHGRHAIARSLRRLDLLPAPAGGLAAGEATRRPLVTRLNRLESNQQALPRTRNALTLITALSVMAAPLAFSAVTFAAIPHC